MPCPDPEVQPILTVPEMGQILGLRSRAAAYKAVHSGDIPFIRVGKRLMIPTAELRKMLGLA
ncbi:helix-turn-helix domain-containing protein [Microtetraspora fusca]|uniref:Helix-turn-helix domain-containing protein n=1 Tax=Microtetraspora fusca TaxID=1997 RepID=A0ABW6VNQ6_MICFU